MGRPAVGLWDRDFNERARPGELAARGAVRLLDQRVRHLLRRVHWRLDRQDGQTLGGKMFPGRPESGKWRYPIFKCNYLS